MGVFSWLTQDTKKSIAATGNVGNRPTFTVFLHDNKGNVWQEDQYEGYGEFGGVDYYEVLAQMNGKQTREEGIEIEMNKPAGTLYPNLTESKDWTWRNVCPEDCEYQGYFYSDPDEPEDDEDYYLAK